MKVLRLRKLRGMSQGRLADLCGTTQQQIAKIERDLVDPKLSTLRRLAEALECELADLFYSKKEFLSELNRIVKSEKLNLKKTTLLALNEKARRNGISSFHPYWELVEIKNNQLRMRGV